jgi:hypothetical protein
MNEAVPPFPLYAFMVKTRATLPCHRTSDTQDANKIHNFLVKCWNFTKNELTEDLIPLASYPITLLLF